MGEFQSKRNSGGGIDMQALGTSRWWLVIIFLGPASNLAEATAGDMARTVPGSVRAYATVHCIGIEWDIQGDANHNAQCTVQYRVQGGSAWRPALPLFRVDYAWYYATQKADRPTNGLAGSILFLRPGTTYELKLDLSDPDGGNESRAVTVATRPVPQLPQGGRTLHVVPDAGGGIGSDKQPFRGLAAAEAAAQPGDVLLLHAGRYGQAALAKPGGKGGQYIVWKAAGDGEVVFDQMRIEASHVWLDGLTLRRAAPSNGIVGKGAVTDTVITRNTLTGFHYGVVLSRECRDWYIADNVIVGDKNWPTGKETERDRDPLSGEGVELNHSDGHVVCYNSISRVADGISYCGHDCDIYGNDIFDVTDDMLEPDYGYANNRLWGNRGWNFANAGLSFQPMYCGPWYFLRNQLIAPLYKDTELRAPHIFKFRVQDRFVLVNNTFVFGKYLDVYCDSLFNALCRNNLFISSTGSKPIWVAMRYKRRSEQETDPALYTLPLQKPGWKTDVDYNGYDWGGDAKDWKTPVFRYDGAATIQEGYCVDLEQFKRLLGIEQHGLRVFKEETFETWNVPADIGFTGPLMLALRQGGKAVDAGAPLPNVCEDFVGRAPDLGALEYGQPLPHYGPRDEQARQQHALDWVLAN
jgi:hypothetical protein